MSSHVNIFLLLFGGLQGLLLSLLLITKKSYRTGYGFLVAYLLVMIAQVVFKVMNKVWLMDNMQVYYALSSKLPLLYGPLVYLFSKSVFRQRKSGIAGSFLHFIPFALVTMFILSPGNDYSPGWIRLLFYDGSGTVIQTISLLLYHYFALAEWQQHFEKLKDSFSNTGQIRMQWLRKFIVASFLVCTAVSLLLYIMYQYYPTLNFLRWGFVLLSVFIYWISYEAISKPSLLVGAIKDNWQEKSVPVLSIPHLVVHKKTGKYASTGLKEQEASRILTRLEQLMQEQKIFLNPEMNIEKLAELAETNRHCVSQVLNERAGHSFYDYINQHRVNEAKRLLMDPEYSNQKIASIAYDAGFNSLSAFNEVFKKVTGMTPSRFKKVAQPVSNQQRG
jgi:AraC-like DNA-binding protein